MKTLREKLVFIIFAIVGAGLIMGGAFAISSNLKFKETAIKTQATIMDIDTHRDSDGDTSHTVYVEFEVDNNTYDGTLGYYSSGMYIGGKTDIYYDPLNPNNFRSSSNDFLGIILIGMGLIFFFIGAGSIFNAIAKKNKNNRLMETGTMISVEFDRVELNTSYQVNGRSPYRIVCRGVENDYNEYISENLWKNPERFIKDREINNFSVYIDVENPKKYYMPLDELNEFLN